MNKIISVLSILLFFTVTLFAQTTVSITDTTSADSTAIVIPVNSGALDSVASLSIFISYDKSVLDFKGIVDNPFAGGNFQVKDNNGVISVSWFNLTPVKITDKLFALSFFYKSGTSALKFTGTNQITDLNNAYNVNFVNGSIGPFPATMGLDKVSGFSGDTVSVAYSGTNLSNLGSITAKIDYDTSAVEYVGLSSNDVGFTNNGVLGQVLLAWADVTGNSPYSKNTGNLAVLRFVVKHGTTNLSFNSGSEVTDESGTSQAITYSNGSVTEKVLPGAVPTFSLSAVKASEGFNVNVPLNFAKITNLGSFTIDVSYDTSVISYVGFDNLISGTLVGNVANGKLVLAWNSPSDKGLTVADSLFANLVFAYKTGNTSLTMNAIEITDFSGSNITSTITLTSGSVSGNMVTISQIQKPAVGNSNGDSPLKGQTVTIKGIVSANYLKGDTLNTGYFIQDSPGEWNGIYVYDTHFIPAPGDSVQVSGTVSEYYNLTEINKIDTLIVISSGNPIHKAVTITAAEFTEGYEGVYVYVPGLATVSEVDSHGEAVLNDGTADLTTDDLLYRFEPALGFTYDVKGIGFYSFGKYLLEPFAADEITDVKDVTGSVLPATYSLEQNYPNPFNPSTVIDFALKENSKVTLNVYNLLGQKVATLINKNMTSGYKSFNFDASNLATGVYLYRIVVKGSNGASYINSKKMILLK